MDKIRHAVTTTHALGEIPGEKQRRPAEFQRACVSLSIGLFMTDQKVAENIMRKCSSAPRLPSMWQRCIPYCFIPSLVIVAESESLIAPGALMMDIKLLLPIMLRSGKLMAILNRAKR